MAMCEAKGFPPCERDELMTLVKGLQRQIAQLAAANERLSKQLAELQRAGKRQAAPFSKGRRDLQPQAAWAQAGSRDVQLPQASQHGCWSAQCLDHPGNAAGCPGHGANRVRSAASSCPHPTWDGRGDDRSPLVSAARPRRQSPPPLLGDMPAGAPSLL